MSEEISEDYTGFDIRHGEFRIFFVFFFQWLFFLRWLENCLGLGLGSAHLRDNHLGTMGYK